MPCTGTLTLNKLSVEQQSVMCISTMAIPDVMKHAALSANTVTEEPIDMVLASCYNNPVRLVVSSALAHSVPNK